MATRLRLAFVTLMLLVIMLENFKPAMVNGYRWSKKKMIGRIKGLESKVEEELQCKPCELIEKLQAAVEKLEKDVAELKQVDCPDGICRPIGVADNNIIPDDNITSSTVYHSYYPYEGRLNGDTGWCPETENDRDDFIQVDMGKERSVCAVATQGKKTRSFVKSYKLSFSTDGANWNMCKEQNVDKIFPGNTDNSDTIVQQSLGDVTRARYVRFYPVDYDKWPCMRIEVFVQ
ncbi:hypothetical protein ACROYT_G031082 [Oculina patagonica]